MQKPKGFNISYWSWSLLSSSSRITTQASTGGFNLEKLIPSWSHSSSSLELKEIIFVNTLFTYLFKPIELLGIGREMKSQSWTCLPLDSTSIFKKHTSSIIGFDSVCCQHCEPSMFLWRLEQMLHVHSNTIIARTSSFRA